MRELARPLAAESSAPPEMKQGMLEALFKSMPAATWIVDLSGRYSYVTDTYAKLVGRTADECIGRSVDEVMPPALARLYALRHKQLLENRAPKRFEQIWPVRGEPRWFEIHMNCLLDETGEPMGVAGYAQDVTQHMEQQESARRVQEGLEKRVAQRTQQLSVTNEELEAFSYSVSHDLRAPLSNIGGFLGLLQENFADQLGPTGSEYVQQIASNAERMNGLIGDLLQLARVNQGGLLRAQVDLTQMVEEILSGLAAQDPGRQVKIVLPNPTYADCDPGLMRAALVNLLSNAWKFTGRVDHPRIQFGCFVRGTFPVYFVRDNGAGFDMKHSDRMFGAFQRFHREAEFPGTGIGLATVKRVIGRHGGQVWAESAPGLGATFYFTLDTPD